MTTRRVEALLLSREWRDRDGGVEINLWGKSPEGPISAHFTGQEAVMFVLRQTATQNGRRVERPLETLGGDPVDALYFRSQRSLTEERERLREELVATLESDVKPADRFLMERFITGSFVIEGTPQQRRGVLHFDNPRIATADFRTSLSVLSIDIETEGFDGPVIAAAFAGCEREHVFVTGAAPSSWRNDLPKPLVSFVRDEAALLRRYFDAICSIDPDVLCGWNVTEFDLLVLQTRAQALGVPFSIGRGGLDARIMPGGGGKGSSRNSQLAIARIPGRVALDGVATMRSATWAFERFTLEHVGQELLGRGKKISKTSDPVAEILRMHRDDPEKLAVYNLEDCRLVLEIFEKAKLVEFTMERARLTGLALDRQGGSVAAFDHLYLPRLHRKGVIAPDTWYGEMTESPGGHVLESTPGLYRNVLSFDFRSLYPSIIRTFQIDPFGMARPGEDPIPGEDGATFAREGAILPELITKLHEARSVAITEKNTELSRAIKILMNSFYGVLGTSGCRFFDPRLPTSITRRGHAIIERARRHFEDEGLAVIYGDTDSLFVHVAGERSEEELRELGRLHSTTLTQLLAEEIAAAYRVESRLELRFESHYLRFLMPTTRGSERGSKKRYAGAVRRPGGELEVVVRGLEAVRRDWTPLARRVQLELLRRVFSDEPFESWLNETARALEKGELDEELVYRKRLRRDLDAYGQGKSGAPPHVQAARALEAEGESESNEVEYVVTLKGPEPTSLRKSPIDYSHYLSRQLEPACDVVLLSIGTSFAKVAGLQTSLF